MKQIILKIKERFKKEKSITIYDLFKEIEDSGNVINYWENFRVNRVGYNSIDNDINELRDGSHVIITALDSNNVLQRFEYFINAEKCEYCTQFKSNKHFNYKHKVCNYCFKAFKNDWKSKGKKHTLEDYIESEKVAKALI